MLLENNNVNIHYFCIEVMGNKSFIIDFENLIQFIVKMTMFIQFLAHL